MKDARFREAAVDVQGLARARTVLAAWDVLAGRSVRPFRLELPVAYACWIVYPKATAGLPKIVTFRDRLVGEAAEDARRLACLRHRR